MNFVDMLAKVMVENELQDGTEMDSNTSFRHDIGTIAGSSQSTSSCSTITNMNSPGNDNGAGFMRRVLFLERHQCLTLTDLKVRDEGGLRTRTMRQRCSLCKKKSPFYCAACQPTGAKMHFWLCNRCVPAHKSDMAAAYDAGSIGDEQELRG